MAFYNSDFASRLILRVLSRPYVVPEAGETQKYSLSSRKERAYFAIHLNVIRTQADVSIKRFELLQLTFQA